MTEIPIEMLTKYNMAPLSFYKERHGDTTETEIGFYKTFLIQTDYITAKIIELTLEGTSREDILEMYCEVLDARQFARDQINEIENAQTERGQLSKTPKGINLYPI